MTVAASRSHAASTPDFGSSAALLLDSVRAHASDELSSSPVVLAVSGGLDSMALAHACVREGIPIIVAHVDYGLRHDSHLDRALVANWCGRNGILFEEHVVRNEDRPATGIQAWARRVRYAFFARVGSKHGAQAVWTAHHANDLLETQLLNLERGTGLSGLCSMTADSPIPVPNEQDVRVVRPMLGISRTELRAIAHEWGVEWREDASNQDATYARNAVRAELEAMSAGELAAFCEKGRELSLRLASVRKRIRSLVADRRTIAFSDMAVLPQWLQAWILQEWVSTHDDTAPRRASTVDRILELQHTQTGRSVQIGSMTVWRERTGWAIQPSSTSRIEQQEWRWDPTTDSELVLEGGTIQAQTVQGEEQNQEKPATHGVFLDLSRLTLPLTIRHWEPGDRFRPEGGVGSRKVKRYLTDAGVPAAIRKDVRVMTSDGEIVWIIGLRADARFTSRSCDANSLALSWADSI